RVGCAARTPPHLRPADQLPDRPARRRAAAADANAVAYAGDDRDARRGTRGRLDPAAAAPRRVSRLASRELIPTGAIRLAALGLLASGPRRYDELAVEVRRFASRMLGPSLDIL